MPLVPTTARTEGKLFATALVFEISRTSIGPVETVDVIEQLEYENRLELNLSSLPSRLLVRSLAPAVHL